MLFPSKLLSYILYLLDFTGFVKFYIFLFQVITLKRLIKSKYIIRNSGRVAATGETPHVFCLVGSGSHWRSQHMIFFSDSREVL
jgi:hypothetical protein